MLGCQEFALMFECQVIVGSEDASFDEIESEIPGSVEFMELNLG